jgi:hypothetical protein
MEQDVFPTDIANSRGLSSFPDEAAAHAALDPADAMILIAQHPELYSQSKWFVVSRTTDAVVPESKNAALFVPLLGDDAQWISHPTGTHLDPLSAADAQAAFSWWGS